MHRFGLASVVLLLATSTTLVACTDPPGGTEGGGSGSATMSTTMTSTTVMPTSNSDTGVMDASASGDGATGSSTGGTATAADSTGSTGSTGSTDGGSTGTTSTQGSDSGGSEESTTGAPACQPLPPQGDSCMVDADCQVFGDCCSCIAYNPNNGAPGSCGGGCGQTVCETLGVDQPVCVGGTCQVLGLSCDQTAVDCAMPPPNCPPGTLPQVATGCYTGGCLPILNCDWVPDCNLCPEDTTCVITQTPGCDQLRCFPDFPKCPSAPPTCDCLGQEACNAPYDSCLIQNDDIVCF